LSPLGFHFQLTEKSIDETTKANIDNPPATISAATRLEKEITEAEDVEENISWVEYITVPGSYSKTIGVGFWGNDLIYATLWDNHKPEIEVISLKQSIEHLKRIQTIDSTLELGSGGSDYGYERWLEMLSNEIEANHSKAA
jgi:hypothetical protein